MQTETQNVRFVIVNSKRYLLSGDVANLLIELGSTETIDTRKRIEELANRLTSQNTITPEVNSI